MFSFTLLTTTVTVRWVTLAGDYAVSVVATRDDGGYLCWVPEEGDFTGIPYLGVV